MGFFDVVNVYGLLFAAVLLVPHIVYMKTHTLDTGVFANRAMVYIDRVGRLASLFLMSFHIGVLELGFTEPQALMRRFWLIVMGVCSVLYALLWLLFFKKETKGCALGIILISSFMVTFSGVLQVNTLLLTAGIVYLIGELYLFSRYFRK